MINNYFGTDGFRGEANVKLTVKHALKIGYFLGYYFKKKQKTKVKIVIGKDTRKSSDMFECALSAGLTSYGANVYLLHVTTTACVAYIICLKKFNCGIMITASHNIFYDNGIKIIDSNGRKINKFIEKKITSYINNEIQISHLLQKENIGNVIDFSIGNKYYIKHLISSIDNNCSLKNKKICIDCANGSASFFVKKIFNILFKSNNIYIINNKPNGININYKCGSVNLDNLKNFLKLKHLDIGFAYDGDADRCIAVDEYGNEINGDLLMYIFSKYMYENKQLNKNTIVITNMSNSGLLNACQKQGILYKLTKIGDKYIYNSIIENNYSIGGEQSGHIIFPKYATTGDGILTSLKLIEIIIKKKQTLNKLCNNIKILPQLIKNIKIYDREKIKNNLKFIKIINNIKKKINNNGRLFIRFSGTEQMLRIMIEERSYDICEFYMKKILNIMRIENLIIK